MEKRIREELWNLLKKSSASYEMKDALVYQAMRAISEKSIERLFDRIVIIKPDDAPEPECSREIAERYVVELYMEKYGLKNYVMKQIA